MVYHTHGTFLVGVDYVDQNIGLPLRWLVILGCVAAAALVGMRRWKLAAAMALTLPIAYLVPVAGRGTLRTAQRDLAAAALRRDPYPRHRAAFGLEQTVKEVEFKAGRTRRSTPRPIAIRSTTCALGWKPFHDTITQRQALRTYYNFHDSDWDRYTIDGRYNRFSSRRARSISAHCRCTRQLDQPCVHLHARLRAGAVRGQQSDA
jgi:uncharacterized membrane protein (UPF0182 family)